MEIPPVQGVVIHCTEYSLITLITKNKYRIYLTAAFEANLD